jgi:DNA-binding GntR family transcriptional regulator
MQTFPAASVVALPLAQVTTLRSQALGILRDSIIRGDAGPGVKLVSSLLAAQLGVSRTPLREALQLLEVEGFVARGPSGVFEVTDLADDDLEELFLLRAQLEALVARFAAVRATPQGIANMEVTLAKMQSAARAGSVEESEALGAEFHRQVKACARLRFTSMQLEVLSGHVDRYRVRTMNLPGRSHAAVDEHVAILNCISRGDGAAAAEAMRHHVWNAWLTVHKPAAGETPGERRPAVDAGRV